jgi:hypothetical protein
MSTTYTSGTYGAKRASWRDSNPRELLRKIWQANQSATENELRDLFWNECKDDTDMLRACVEYTFDNALTALHKNPERTAQRRQANLNSGTTAKSALKDRIHREAQIILLELEMPNGKQLRACTGTECRTFGGWFGKLAIKAGKRRVGEVLSEGEVRKIWLTQKATK